MLHLRRDYTSRIQDAGGTIPAGEPVFLIRGQDICAPVVIRAWADAAEKRGVAPAVVYRVRQYADEVTAWQRENGAKRPDVPIELLEPVGFLRA